MNLHAFARCVVAALALGATPVAGEFEPTNMRDWIWWKLGYFQDWGENSIAIPTSLGKIQAWTFGNRTGRVALTLHGGMDVHEIHHEFDHAAVKLAEAQGMYVISPNFHSLRATSPGKITTAKMAILLQDILKWVGARKFAIVLGKGWGGALASRVSVASPSLVSRVVMIAPNPLRSEFSGGKASNFNITVPSLLLYAIDDTSVDQELMATIRKSSPSITGGFGHYRGGHVVLDAYNEDIAWFAKRDFPDHDNADDEDDEPRPSHSEEL